MVDVNIKILLKLFYFIIIIILYFWPEVIVKSYSTWMKDLFLTNTHMNLFILLHRTLIWLLCELLVDYCDVWSLILTHSAVWTYILTAPIHCRGSLVSKLCNANISKICSDEETNSSTAWMAWGSKVVAHFHFWVNYSFNSQTCKGILLI